MSRIVLIATAILGLFACTDQEPKGVESIAESISAEALIQETITAHGGELYDSAHFQFIFREYTYRFQNNGNSYRYERKGLIKGDSIHDVLINGKLTRQINGAQVELSEEEKAKYAESINSVIYFASLPHKLKDEAVIAQAMDKTTIADKSYEVIQVTFKQEGGGTDFDDVYYYWINSENKEIDFLAYNYQVNGGGVRFRSAYNKRKVKGILFQDYVNYKAPVGTPLNELPKLFEKEQLEILSAIETGMIQAID